MDEDYQSIDNLNNNSYDEDTIVHRLAAVRISEDSYSSTEDIQSSPEGQTYANRFNLKSCLLGVLEFADLILPISAAVMGAAFINHCPANWLLPWFVFLIGAETTVVLIYFWMKMIWENYLTFQNIWTLHYWTIQILLAIEYCLFFFTTSTNDSTAENYCSAAFYYYTAIFNVLMLLALCTLDQKDF